MALTQVSTKGIKDAEVKTADIADENVTLAKLEHGTSGNNGKFLRANNGADPTWETVDTSIADDSIAEVKLDISNAPADGKFLQYKDSSDKLTWATVSTTPEGTAILSTGESGGTKFLREDGDNSCSWQSVPAGTPTGGNSGANKIFWENEQTVTHDYTITNARNAGTFGPVTINSGVTVTVGDGEYWTII